MLNMIKMDLYRMVKTKSFYVILFIMIFVTVLTTYLEKVVMDELPELMHAVQEQTAQMEEMEEDPVNLGMSVSVAAMPGEKITVFDMFYANSQGKALSLFLVIFTVIFAMADVNSGYIKNIGGQVKNRGRLILSKAFSLLVFTLIFSGISLLFQAVSNRIFFGYLEWGNGKEFLVYLGLSTLLCFALEMICMAIATLLRNNVFSMIIAVCLCMNVMTIVYNVIDILVEKLGAEDFRMLNYTVTGKLSLLPMDPAGRECVSAIVIALLYSAVSILFSCAVFQKRDI